MYFLIWHYWTLEVREVPLSADQTHGQHWCERAGGVPPPLALRGRARRSHPTGACSCLPNTRSSGLLACTAPASHLRQSGGGGVECEQPQRTFPRSQQRPKGGGRALHGATQLLRVVSVPSGREGGCRTLSACFVISSPTLWSGRCSGKRGARSRSAAVPLGPIRPKRRKRYEVVQCDLGMRHHRVELREP